MSNETNRTNNSKSQKPRRSGGDALPSPELLEGYNYVVEGSAKMILTMFENEQKHRHEWENQAIKTHSFSTILGQVLGFMIAVSVFISATIIGLRGDSTIAAFIWVFGMAIIVMSGMVWLYAKSMGQRPLFARPTFRAHFRPEKESEQREQE